MFRICFSQILRNEKQKKTTTKKSSGQFRQNDIKNLIYQCRDAVIFERRAIYETLSGN